MNLQWVNKGSATLFGKGAPMDFGDPAFAAPLAQDIPGARHTGVCRGAEIIFGAVDSAGLCPPPRARTGAIEQSLRTGVPRYDGALKNLGDGAELVSVASGIFRQRIEQGSPVEIKEMHRWSRTCGSSARSRGPFARRRRRPGELCELVGGERLDGVEVAAIVDDVLGAERGRDVGRGAWASK